VSDTLVKPIRQATDSHDKHSPIDSAATRHLCAGVYVDRSFRDLILCKIHNDARHRVAPSYGFDLVPVVRHAWWSWLLDTGQLLAMLGILVAGLAIDSLLAAVVVWCVVVLCLLLRRIARMFPEVLRLQVERVSEHWGLQDCTRRRRVSDRDLQSRKRLLKAMLAGCLITAVAPLVVSYLLKVPLTSAARPAIVISSVLVSCAIVAGVVRQLLLNAVAHAETLRPQTLTRREKIINEQQDHVCVIYHRPPHQDDDADPLDLLMRTDTPSPFLGSGKLVNRWLPPLTLQLLQPGEGSLQQREYTRPPFTAHKLVETLRAALIKLGSDPGAENLPGLKVRDRIYIAAADYSADGGLIRGGLGKREIWQIIDDHRLTGHHFLETSVPIFGGELVATVLLRVSIKGRCLSLDVATCALTRTPGAYHVIDKFGERGTGAVLRSAARSALAVPVDVMRMWRLLGIPVVLGWAWWAQKDRTVVPRRRTIRSKIAVREEIADAWENAQLDRTTIYDHMKIIEQRILKTTRDFLQEHGVDISVFEKQATNIINSGVLNMGGSQMTIGQLAAGVGAQLINNGFVNSRSEGASA
jgi:hypothetical protein